MDTSSLAGQQLLLAFRGTQLTPEMAQALERYRPAGVTFFRSLNIENPAQVRALTDALQQKAKELGLPGLLIAADQEGGQLVAVGEGATLLPGNMALGATGSEELAEKAGEVIGRELAAMGINVNYAPVCDVNINPRNPVIGTRSFGESPELVARLAAAVIRGIQSCGVAATAKHFPGHGDSSTDSHLGLPAVNHSLERLRQVELVPFQAAIQAGVKLVMSAHLAMPAVDGESATPATLSPRILQGILREELGFQGVIVSDAMDMLAIRQGEALGEEAVRALNAGIDLLLLTTNPADHQRVVASLAAGLPAGASGLSTERILALKAWLNGQPQPDLSVVGCAEHREIAAEIARRSITLVRDYAGLLPLHLKPQQRLGVVMPQPADLTPADTSSYVHPGLTTALRSLHPQVEEISIPHNPGPAKIAAALDRLHQFDCLILCTLNAFASAGQAELVRQALRLGIPTIVVALRMPYDLAVFPEAPTFVCAYSIQEPSMQALAQALVGKIEFQGCLPVSIAGLYPAGHGR